MIAALKRSFFEIISVIKEKFFTNAKKTLTTLSSLFTIILVLFNSGDGFVVFGASAKARMILYIILTGYLLILFALNFDINLFKALKKRKKYIYHLF